MSKTDVHSILLNRRRSELAIDEPYCCCSLYRIRHGLCTLAVFEYWLVTYNLIVVAAQLAESFRCIDSLSSKYALKNVVCLRGKTKLVVMVVLLALTCDRIRMYHVNDNFCIGLFGMVDSCDTNNVPVNYHNGLHSHNTEHSDPPIVMDYIIALLTVGWLVASSLMLCAVLLSSPFLLLPHCVIQCVSLAVSITYFALYAYDYFWTEMALEYDKMEFKDMAERLWLCCLFLIIAGFEVYLLLTVIEGWHFLRAYNDHKKNRIQQYKQRPSLINV